MAVRSDKKLFSQKSTLRAKDRINGYREPKSPNPYNTKFFDRNCVVCRKNFVSRHPYTKYCSHECQKDFYLKQKNKSKK